MRSLWLVESRLLLGALVSSFVEKVLELFVVLRLGLFSRLVLHGILCLCRHLLVTADHHVLHHNHHILHHGHLLVLSEGLVVVH